MRAVTGKNLKKVILMDSLYIMSIGSRIIVDSSFGLSASYINHYSSGRKNDCVALGNAFVVEAFVRICTRKIRCQGQ